MSELAAMTKFVNRCIDEDEEALKFTTALGRWEAHRNYAAGRRGELRHKPSNDLLADFIYPADAEHAERYQPRRALAEIYAKRQIVALADATVIRIYAWLFQNREGFNPDWSPQ
jgi:hypothetical protein